LNDILQGNNVVQEIAFQQELPAVPLGELNLLALADEELQQVPHLPNVQIDVLGEEIPYDQLVEFNNNEPPILPEGNNLHQNEIIEEEQQNNLNILNVGMVLIQHNGPDLMAEYERKKWADSTRIWAQHFSPGRPNCTSVSIPFEWANFFTCLLMNLESYCWTKEFLSSKVTSCLEGNQGLIDYSLPKDCPSNAALLCSSSENKVISTTVSKAEELKRCRHPRGGTKGKGPPGSYRSKKEPQT